MKGRVVRSLFTRRRLRWGVMVLALMAAAVMALWPRADGAGKLILENVGVGDSEYFLHLKFVNDTEKTLYFWGFESDTQRIVTVSAMRESPGESVPKWVYVQRGTWCASDMALLPLAPGESVIAWEWISRDLEGQQIVLQPSAGFLVKEKWWQPLWDRAPQWMKETNWGRQLGSGKVNSSWPELKGGDEMKLGPVVVGEWEPLLVAQP